MSTKERRISGLSGKKLTTMRIPKSTSTTSTILTKIRTAIIAQTTDTQTAKAKTMKKEF